MSLPINRGDGVSRSIAESNNCRYCSPTEGHCCLRKKVIVFDDRMQWKGRIIIPQENIKVTVNECRGVCDPNRVQHTTYAQLLALFQQRTPCCVPTKLSAVSVFVYKGDSVEQEELDIVAEECGCV